jgi:hypothetical protein
MTAFTPSRPDGRSDRRVVYELAADTQPDTKFTYVELGYALAEGLDQPVARDRIYRAVGEANKTLLREKKRYLSVVAREGYRVIGADEHLPVALTKKDKAQTYLKRGIDLLRNVRLGELDETQRSLHQAQLMVLGGLYQSVKESERRHERSEELIADLVRSRDAMTQRIERLETGQ